MKPAPTHASRSPARPGVGLWVVYVLLGALGFRCDAMAADGPTERDMDTTTVVGWQAIELMQRDRREQRGVPRMLPLLSSRNEQGRLWLGLSRPRRDADGAANVQLEMVWLIPLSR